MQDEIEITCEYCGETYTQSVGDVVVFRNDFWGFGSGVFRAIDTPYFFRNGTSAFFYDGCLEKVSDIGIEADEVNFLCSDCAESMCQ